MAPTAPPAAAAPTHKSLIPPENDQPRAPTPLIDTAGISQNLTAATSPTTPHTAADAARAMSSTDAWQPRLDRRQSWDSQEYKHALQKTIIGTSGAAGKPESGFTERR